MHSTAQAAGSAASTAPPQASAAARARAGRRRLPPAGESVPGGEFARYAGGKGANQAVAAARAGARVSFVGRHGDDEFGRAAKAGLRDEGIDVRHFRACADAPSGIALILIGGR